MMHRSPSGRFSGLSKAAEPASEPPPFHEPLPALVAELGDPAVRWVDDQRRPRLAVEDGYQLAGVDEEAVVTAGPSGRGVEARVARELPADGRCLPVGVAVGVARLHRGPHPSFDLGNPLPGHDRVLSLRALNRRDGRIGPVALHIGVSGGRPRDHPVGCHGAAFLGDRPPGRPQARRAEHNRCHGQPGAARSTFPGAARLPGGGPTGRPTESGSCASVHTSAPRRTRRT